MHMQLRTFLSSRGITAFLLLAGLAGTASAQLLYVPDFNAARVSEFLTNSGTLSGLSCLAIPNNTVSVAPSLNPQGLALTPNAKFLYAADSGAGGGISAFSVGSASSCLGRLTPLASSANCPNAAGETCPTYSQSGSPWGLAIDPGGNYLFVTLKGGNEVAVYAINPTTGALTALSTYPTMYTILGVPSTVSPNAVVAASVGANEYLYLTASTPGVVVSYTIGAGGTLSNPITYAVNGGTGTNPQGIATNGTSVYVTDNSQTGIGSPGLLIFGINAATGTLNTPPTAVYSGGNNPQGVAVSADGTAVYVANTGGTLAAFQANGTPGAQVAWGGHPVGVTVDPATGDVYASDQNSNEIRGFTAGLAAPIAGSPFSTGANSAPGQFLVAHSSPAANPTVPAASDTSLALLAILLMGCAGFMYRRTARSSSVR